MVPQNNFYITILLFGKDLKKKITKINGIFETFRYTRYLWYMRYL